LPEESDEYFKVGIKCGRGPGIGYAAYSTFKPLTYLARRIYMWGFIKSLIHKLKAETGEIIK